MNRRLGWNRYRAVIFSALGLPGCSDRLAALGGGDGSGEESGATGGPLSSTTVNTDSAGQTSTDSGSQVTLTTGVTITATSGPVTSGPVTSGPVTSETIGSTGEGGDGQPNPTLSASDTSTDSLPTTTATTATSSVSAGPESSGPSTQSATDWSSTGGIDGSDGGTTSSATAGSGEGTTGGPMPVCPNPTATSHCYPYAVCGAEDCVLGADFDNATVQVCQPVPEDGNCGECGSACLDEALALANACLCYGGNMASVLCGPVEYDDQVCCWTVLTNGTWFCGDGRPLMIDGEAKVAPLCTRKDWLAAIAPALPTALRDAVADAFARMAQAEHASVGSFARFVLQLLQLGAPPELLVSAQQAMAEEIEHAKIGFAIASAFSGRNIGPGALGVAGALGDAGTLGTSVDAWGIVASAVIEGCIGETLSAIEVGIAAEDCIEPTLKAALRGIAEDELRHAALAWSFLRWALQQHPEFRGRIVELFAAAISERAVPDPKPISEHTADRDPMDTRAFGILPAAEKHALARAALQQVVLPAARVLLQDRVAMDAEQPRA